MLHNDRSPLINSSERFGSLGKVDWEMSSKSKSIAKGVLIGGLAIAALGGIASLTVMGFPLHGLGAIGSYMVIGGAGLAAMGLVGFGIAKVMEAREKNKAKQDLNVVLKNLEKNEDFQEQLTQLKEGGEKSFKREVKLNNKTYLLEVFDGKTKVSNHGAEKAPKNLKSWSFSNKGMDFGKKLLIASVALVALGLIVSFGAGGFPIHGLGAFGGMMIAGGAGAGVLGIAIYGVGKAVAKYRERQAKKELDSIVKDFSSGKEMDTLNNPGESFKVAVKPKKNTYYIETFHGGNTKISNRK